MRLILAAALLVLGLTSVSASAAKDFRPGDLRLCNAKQCVLIADRALLRALSAFVYNGAQPKLADTPRLGAPVFELRFRNGYVAGLIGAARLDRFRSHGVICGRFRRGSWYRLPPALARELRRLAGPLDPLRLTARVPRSC